jgi:serine/threonine-protein kinase HipA
MNRTAEHDLELESERSKILMFGLNADPNKCYYEHSRGRLERVVSGIYLDARITPVERRALLTKNAARIALHMYPQGMLAGSSAFHRGAVEGHVMIATPRGGKAVDVGGVLTIYNGKTDLDLGLNREVEFVTIEDSFGEYSIKRVADEMLILKNFIATKTRPRSTYLNNADLNKVVERCMRTMGGRDPFKRRIEALAKAHGMAHYLRQVNAFIDNAASYSQAEKPLQAFRVFWHRTPVATLSHDGHIWNFEYDAQVQIQLSMHEKKGRGSPPSFLGSLLPETGVKAGRSMEENLSDFGRGHRYISNITVQAAGSVGIDREIIIDMLDGELPHYRDPHLEFSGTATDDLLDVMGDEDLLSSLHRDPESPRMSGMQIKLAANLDRTGKLSSANGKAFTHIIKIVGSNPKYQSMCAMEWFSLTVAQGCGLKTEEYAIADIGGYGPSLVVERFDVRRDLNDKRMILTEDFWSIQGMVDNRQKYAGELMDVADTVVKKSTDLETDSRHLLAQAVFSWLTWNGDMHLKNLLLVKETKDPRRGFDSIRLSPIYDVLCTQVYPDDAKSAAIGLAGNRNHTLAGFRALGKKLGIERDEVDAIVDHLTVSIPLWARKVAGMLPGAIADHPQSVSHIEQARKLFDTRCLMMISELENAKKGSRSRRAAEVEADVGSFAADAPDASASAAEHIDAEQRRSWIPAESRLQGQRRARP